VDTTWMVEGLCRDSSTEVFFPDDGVGGGQAQRICARCSVKALCLEYSLHHRIAYGIWGGVSERERLRLLLQPATNPAGQSDTLFLVSA
jgi:WhiB family redox-sensing transcriptional regulator